MKASVILKIEQRISFRIMKLTAFKLTSEPSEIKFDAHLYVVAACKLNTMLYESSGFLSKMLRTQKQF